MATDRWATDQDDEGADKALERLSSHHIHPVLLDFLEDVDTAEGGYGVVRRARLHHVDVPLDDKVTFKLITQDEKHYVVPAERPKLEKLVSTFFPQYKQHLVTHSEDVAVKGLMFFSHVALSRMKRRFVREILVWLQFDHPNVLPLLGFHLDFRQSIAWFVSPWGTYGSISDYVAKKDPKISSDEVLRLLEGTAKGLAYLHNHNPTVCHGDIKAANVLVGSKRQALLCDFGLATMVDGESAGLQTSYSFKGSIRWCSRELLDTGQRTGSSDIWAWGFLVYEVITGKVPFQDVPGQVAVMRRILDGELPTAKETPEFDGAAPLWDLVQWCWSAEPGDRPTINECLLTLQPLLKSTATIEVKSLHARGTGKLPSDVILSGVDSPAENRGLSTTQKISIRDSGKVGGEGGRPFSDSFTDERRIRGITVYSHQGIHQFRVLYGRGENLFWADEHGTTAGGWNLKVEEFKLEPDEVITRVQGRSGGKIDGFQFYTNKNRASQWCGGRGGNPFTWKGHELLYFSGRAGDQLDALQAHWAGRPRNL